MSTRFLAHPIRTPLTLAAACVFVGCGTPVDSELSANADGVGANVVAEDGTSDSSLDTSEREIALAVVDEAGFRQALEKHRGKVVFIDYWATWCGACKEEFPNTVALHDKYADNGLAVISMSFDTEDRHEAAVEFLDEQGATFENLRSRYGAEDASFEMCSFDDNLPYYQLYDRDGKLVQGFSFSDPVGPVITFADIQRAVQEQLNVRREAGDRRH
jgi:thiol-disulfide isomerase/thioredoxin